MQGPKTDRTRVRQVKKALGEYKFVHEILHNYRKDGSIFLNELFINPIRNAEGVTTHFVGCQNAVDLPSLASLQLEAAERQNSLTMLVRYAIALGIEFDDSNAA